MGVQIHTRQMYITYFTGRVHWGQAKGTFYFADVCFEIVSQAAIQIHLSEAVFTCCHYGIKGL